MSYEQRDNSGTLFKNDTREKDTHPNAKGKAMIDGRMYYVSAWTKEGAKGKFQSLSFKAIENDAQEKPSRESFVRNVEREFGPGTTVVRPMDDDSDLPF